MGRAKKKAEKPDTPPTYIRTISLTEKAGATLQALSQEASDSLGWTVSGSAIVRALLRHAEQQGLAWTRAHLVPLLEAELNAGVLWGKRSTQKSE